MLHRCHQEIIGLWSQLLTLLPEGTVPSRTVSVCTKHLAITSLSELEVTLYPFVPKLEDHCPGGLAEGFM